MTAPPVMSPGVRRSMMPSENIIPADGPPTFSKLKEMSRGSCASMLR